MKLAKLIKKMEALQKKHGDVDVTISSDEEMNSIYLVHDGMFDTDEKILILIPDQRKNYVE